MEEKINENSDIILGLDISTTTIGCCVFLDDKSDYGKIIKLTHIVPKISSKIKGIESLFLKKDIFENEFLSQWKDTGIKRVIIEEPLLRSNNVNTVGTLLRFNGMISDSVYRVLGIVPEYISSYDARKYAFPELISVRKFNKKGEVYPIPKLCTSINKHQLVLFGEMPWDIDKKQCIWNKVSEIYPDINWVYDRNGDLKKENFDATDALITCLAILNKNKYGELEPKSKVIETTDTNIIYDIEYWNTKHSKKIGL